jgi:hypothetical protein
LYRIGATSRVKVGPGGGGAGLWAAARSAGNIAADEQKIAAA